MDPDVQKLTLLLILQLFLFTTLECISRDREMDLLWHWQQLASLTFVLRDYKLSSGRQ